MMTFAMILSALSFVGVLLCFTIILRLMQTLGKLTTQIERLGVSVEKVERSIADQRAAIAELKARQAEPRALPAANNLTDGIISGLVGVAGNRIPAPLLPIASFLLRTFVGYLGQRSGKKALPKRAALASQEKKQ